MSVNEKQALPQSLEEGMVTVTSAITLNDFEERYFNEQLSTPMQKTRSSVSRCGHSVADAVLWRV